MPDERLDRQAISRKMQDHYAAVWQSGDKWSFETSEYEQRRYDFQMTLLAGRRYDAVLEIGCGSGELTRRLAPIGDRLLAIDIAPTAIARARARLDALAQTGSVELRTADIMTLDVAAEGPWDLIVFSETIYCVGWLYPMFDIALMAANLCAATRPGGRLLLSNTYGREKDWLQRPWLIDTYRDLFSNVGFTLEREDILTGVKDSVELRLLTSMFVR